MLPSFCCNRLSNFHGDPRFNGMFRLLSLRDYSLLEILNPIRNFIIISVRLVLTAPYTRIRTSQTGSEVRTAYLLDERLDDKRSYIVGQLAVDDSSVAQELQYLVKRQGSGIEPFQQLTRIAIRRSIGGS